MQDKDEKKEKRYTVTIRSDQQMDLIKKISELYLRERFGQFRDLAEDLSTKCAGYTIDPAAPDHKAKFDAYIRRRDAAREAFDKAYLAAGREWHRTTQIDQAQDLFEVIRYAIWSVSSGDQPSGTITGCPDQHLRDLQDLPVCYKDKRDGTWKVELGRDQLRLVQDMSENFMRERTGQFFLLADDIAFDLSGMDLASMDEDTRRRIFSERSERVGEAIQLFETGYKLSGAADYGCKSDETLMAYDIYGVIMHFFWEEDPDPGDHIGARKPLHEYEEVPLIEIDRG